MKRSPMPPRKSGLSRQNAPIARSAPLRATNGLRRADAPRTPQQERRALVEAEWVAFSTMVRRRRPTCEARDVWLAAVDTTGEPLRGRLLVAIADCRGWASEVHHRRSRNLGPTVPSQGLTEDDVVSICHPCHHYAETDLCTVARNGGMLR